MENIKWRVMLQAEDGEYCLEDNFINETAAERHAYKLQSNYGDGQVVYVEPYKAH